jgi:hypothetical protein
MTELHDEYELGNCGMALYAQARPGIHTTAQTTESAVCYERLGFDPLNVINIMGSSDDMNLRIQKWNLYVFSHSRRPLTTRLVYL